MDVYAYKKTNRRYDPMNLYPTLKAIIDGFTDYGLWEDDDHIHLEGPFIQHGGKDPDNPRFEIIIKELS